MAKRKGMVPEIVTCKQRSGGTFTTTVVYEDSDAGSTQFDSGSLPERDHQSPYVHNPTRKVTQKKEPDDFQTFAGLLVGSRPTTMRSESVLPLRTPDKHCTHHPCADPKKTPTPYV